MISPTMAPLAAFAEEQSPEIMERIFEEFNSLSIVYRRPSAVFIKVQYSWGVIARSKQPLPKCSALHCRRCALPSREHRAHRQVSRSARRSSSRCMLYCRTVRAAVLLRRRHRCHQSAPRMVPLLRSHQQQRRRRWTRQAACWATTSKTIPPTGRPAVLLQPCQCQVRCRSCSPAVMSLGPCLCLKLLLLSYWRLSSQACQRCPPLFQSCSEHFASQMLTVKCLANFCSTHRFFGEAQPIIGRGRASYCASTCIRPHGRPAGAERVQPHAAGAPAASTAAGVIDQRAAVWATCPRTTQ